MDQDLMFSQRNNPYCDLLKISAAKKYDDALYYRAALYMNKQNEERELDIPITTGLWELGEYMDEYNKQTGRKYLLLSSSNGVEKGSDSDVKAGKNSSISSSPHTKG